jgi:hypothetical protein
MRRAVMAVLFCAGSAFGQVPNGGFEQWSSGEPDVWATSNAAPLYTNVTLSTTAHTGVSAVRGEVMLVPGTSIVANAVLQSGVEGGGFPVTSQHLSMTGWYRLTAVGDDELNIAVAMFGAGEAMGLGLESKGAAASWTKFTVPIDYFSPGTADTCIIHIKVAGPGNSTPHEGTVFLLDDLEFSGLSAVNEGAMPAGFALEQNYPNPFNPSTTIAYHLGGESAVRLSVFDVLGREVAVLENGVVSAGAHRATFDGAGLASGMYVTRLKAIPVDGSAARVEQRTMLLVK